MSEDIRDEHDAEYVDELHAKQESDLATKCAEEIGKLPCRAWSAGLGPKANFYDPHSILSGQVADIIFRHYREVESEVKRLRERVGPVSPQGDDYIDELESAIGFLRNRRETLESENIRLREG